MAKTRTDPPSFDPKEMFSYKDGQLFWKQSGRGRKVGSAVGSRMISGYINLNIKGRYFYIHRLVYLFHTGRWPEVIDHIDCDRSNNKIENLREVSKSQNALNTKSLHPGNKSGFKGVYWSKVASKWVAQCTTNRKTIYLGCFDDPVEAAKKIKAYLTME